MAKKNTKPATVKKTQGENGNPGIYQVRCPMSRCKGYHEDRTSQQGAHQEKARHNRDKHAIKKAVAA